MYSKNFPRFIFACMILTLLVLLIFVILHWFQVPTGHFLDWIVSIVSFWWLLVLVTLPWNMHFRAKEVLLDATASKAKGITVKEDEVEYVSKVYRRSFIMAIALHLVSAVGLYVLAATGISAVGYIGAGAALLLTGLRPAIRAYEYVVSRLAGIDRRFKYPREDVLELRQRVKKAEEKIKNLGKQLNPKEPGSLATEQQKRIRAIEEEVSAFRVEVANLRVTNQSEHAQLSREAQHAIAQMTEDGQILEHVREIIRFFKTAGSV